MTLFSSIPRLATAFFLFLFPLGGVEETRAPVKPGKQQESESDAELKILEKRLAELRKKTLNDEMEAQPLMFDNWHEYAEKIKTMEEDQKEVQALKERINQLTKPKEQH